MRPRERMEQVLGMLPYLAGPSDSSRLSRRRLGAWGSPAGHGTWRLLL